MCRHAVAKCLARTVAGTVTLLVLSLTAYALDDRPFSTITEQDDNAYTILERARSWGHPPFQAWVRHSFTYVRDHTTLPSPIQGVLHRGDRVTVVGCVPECSVSHARALLSPWNGSVPIRSLNPLPVDSAGKRTGWDASYVYGRTFRGKTPVFETPKAGSKIIRKEGNEFRLAFVPNESLLSLGWLQRPDGGFMRYADIKMFTESKFRGIMDPPARVAFALRPVRVAQSKGGPQPTIKRHDHREVLAQRGNKILLDEGWVPRARFRVAARIDKQKNVLAARKWIHIDLSEQVLTAYEGNKHVFSTMVSTGKSSRRSTRTHPGNYFIYAKTVHSTMRGKAWDPYFAEEIPYVMHFDWGRALHGTYWHNDFGKEKSHGCINLSFADAKWLFEWADPALPEGWHTVVSQTGRLPTVDVIVVK